MHFGAAYYLQLFKNTYENTCGSVEMTQTDLKENYNFFFQFACPNCRRGIRNSWSLRLKLTETLLKIPVLSNRLISNTFS